MKNWSQSSSSWWQWQTNWWEPYYGISFLTKLHQVPSLQGLLPFVRSTYARTTTYTWEDDAGVRHQIRQAEGGEQGDPLMPLLLSLGIHDSLSTVRSRMRRQDSLFACLDDVQRGVQHSPRTAAGGRRDPAPHREDQSVESRRDNCSFAV